MRTHKLLHLLVSTPGSRVSDNIVVRRNAAILQVEVQVCGNVDNFVGSITWEHDRYAELRSYWLRRVGLRWPLLYVDERYTFLRMIRGHVLGAGLSISYFSRLIPEGWHAQWYRHRHTLCFSVNPWKRIASKTQRYVNTSCFSVGPWKNYRSANARKSLELLQVRYGNDTYNMRSCRDLRANNSSSSKLLTFFTNTPSPDATCLKIRRVPTWGLCGTGWMVFCVISRIGTIKMKWSKW